MHVIKKAQRRRTKPDLGCRAIAWMEPYRTHKYKMQELLNVKAAGTYNYHSALKG
jgi:hypothetical protein